MLYCKDMSDTLPDEKVMLEVINLSVLIHVLGSYYFCFVSLSSSFSIKTRDSVSHCPSEKLEEDIEATKTKQ